MRAASLRSRLLLATAALVALGLVAASGATYWLLRSSLLKRVDEQLVQAYPEARGALLDYALGARRRPPGKHALGPVTYIAVLDAGGRIVAAGSVGFGADASPPALPRDLPGSYTADTAEPYRLFTADAVDGSVRYRVLAAPRRGDGGTIVVGYPLADVDSTLRRLLLVEGLVGVLVLGIAAGGAWKLVDVGLRPLARMEQTARDIAGGDLSKRVEPADAETEVGRLGGSLNVMLERIEEAFAERRAAEERLRRFVADASHELRTPLTSIRGYAELFRHGADTRPEDLAKSMRRIEDESTRMTQLVEELLLLARLDEGRPLEREPVDVATVARDAVEDARVMQPQRPIEFSFDGSSMVAGDEARLRQVVANLLSNALEHTPPTAAVRVRVRGDDRAVALEVSDDGPGMDEQDARHVFDRFFRADKARSRAEGHLGLGLSIAAAIVQAHGGTIDVASRRGEGTTFTVTLPRG